MTSLLDYLREDGVELRKEGPRWLALCPFHNEKTPSFTVEPEKGDGGLYKCFGCGEGGDSVTYLEKARKLTKKEALRLHKGPSSGERTGSGSSDRSPEHKTTAKPKQPYFSRDLPTNTIATYDYRGADRKLKFKVAKLPPKDGRDKDFRALAPARKGSVKGWLWKQPFEKDRPLYRLPELLAADPSQQVMVVEGEKCVHAVLEAFPKVVVTTWSHGSKSWKRNDYSPLYGRDVLLVADADECGRKAMTGIADLLVENHSTVRVVLPLGETGNDIADEIKKGGTKGAAKWLRGLAKDYELPKPEVADARDLGKAADATSAGGTADALDESGPPAAPDTLDAAETTDTPDAGAASDTADTTIKPNWVEDLLKRAKKDPGAPFEPEFIEKMAELRRTNMPAWVRLRAKLRDYPDISVGLLDQTMKGNSGDLGISNLQGLPLEWQYPEPWEEEVDGADVLDHIVELFLRYISMSEEQDHTLAIWILYSWLHDRWKTSTFLGVTSATRRCGKSTLLEIIQDLTYRPLNIGSQTTSPALFRTIQEYKPTLILDEFDTYFHLDGSLRGMLNSSQRLRGAQTLRTDKVDEKHVPAFFKTWCPKVIAGTGDFPSTIYDRSIVIVLKRRKKSDEEMEFWGDHEEAEIERIRRRLARWAKDHSASVYRKRKTVDFPPGLHDRARDGWAPLLTIGELVGGEWSGEDGRAWQACVKITASTKDETDIGERLLADIRKVFFQERDPDYLPTVNKSSDLYNETIPGILQKLNAMEESPWGDINQGKPLTSNGLAKRLKRFEIKPHTIRLDAGLTAKGYRRTDFLPVWERYDILEPEEPPNSSG